METYPPIAKFNTFSRIARAAVSSGIIKVTKSAPLIKTYSHLTPSFLELLEEADWSRKRSRRSIKCIKDETKRFDILLNSSTNEAMFDLKKSHIIILTVVLSSIFLIFISFLLLKSHRKKKHRRFNNIYKKAPVIDENGFASIELDTNFERIQKIANPQEAIIDLEDETYNKIVYNIVKNRTQKGTI